MTAPTSHVVGTTRGHAGQGPTDVHAWQLESDDTTVVVWEYGARLVEMRVPDRDGRVANVVLRHPTLAGYEPETGPHAYLGATVGRYANRIGGGRISVDGRGYQLETNEGPNQLHGGPIGFDQYVWESAPDGPSSVTFRHRSPDGDQGFPGGVAVEVTYSLDGPELTLATSAVVDADTVIGMTNHAYWHLGGGGGTVADHVLDVACDRYVEVDDAGIPTGEILPVEGSMLDFREATSVAAAVAAGGIDNSYVFGEPNASGRISHPDSGRVLTVTSDQIGLQLYTGQFLPAPFTGMCLEAQRLPDTPNHPSFGSAVVRAGETYRHRVSYACSAPGD